jgi:hypothetical protein
LIPMAFQAGQIGRLHRELDKNWADTVYLSDGHSASTGDPLVDRTTRNALTLPNGSLRDRTVEFCGAMTQRIGAGAQSLVILSDSANWTVGSKYTWEISYLPSDSARHVLWCQSNNTGSNSTTSVIIESQATSRNLHIIIMHAGGSTYTELTLGALSLSVLNHILVWIDSGTAYARLNGGTAVSASLSGNSVLDSTQAMRQNYAEFSPSVSYGNVAYCRVTKGVVRDYQIFNRLLPVGG